MLTQQLLNGISLGFAYGVLATGLSLGQSVSGVINFAHGDLFVLAAFLTLTLQSLGYPYLLCGLISICLTAAIGLVFAWLVLDHLVGSIEKSLATIALSLGLTDAMLLAFGSDTAAFRRIYPEGVIRLGTAVTDWATIFAALLLAAVTILFTVFREHTNIGLALRATAEDPLLASRLGIPINWYRRGAFVIAAVLAALAAAIIGPTWQINYRMGEGLTLMAFTGAMIGGLGNPTGALAGGIVLGLAEALFAGYVSSSWRDLFIYALLILLLVIRGRGLIRETERRVA
jgi:branched-chain amino acid transport system permease protein